MFTGQSVAARSAATAYPTTSGRCLFDGRLSLGFQDPVGNNARPAARTLGTSFTATTRGPDLAILTEVTLGNPGVGAELGRGGALRALGDGGVGAENVQGDAQGVGQVLQGRQAGLRLASLPSLQLGDGFACCNSELSLVPVGLIPQNAEPSAEFDIARLGGVFAHGLVCQTRPSEKRDNGIDLSEST